jgi:hypothetical protein
VFPGTANSYISFGTTGQPFSNSNIYSFGDFVVEAWVNPVSFANSPILVGYGDPTNQNNLSWYFEIATNGQLQWFTSLNGTLSEAKTNTSLSLGAWTHIAAIHQSASKRVQIYINGTPQTFAVGSQGWSASGTILTYTTGIIPSSAYQTVIGQIYNSTYAYNGSLTNLRIVTGSGAAQIYNNNAFTPSTTPLFPASNTAGGSLTTRLLVRVPLAPGKMVVPKLGGANCNTVLAFPPAPMTGYATNMTGQSYYGGGVYVASASSEYSTGNYAWQAFDKSTGTIWAGNGAYSPGVPYSGTVATVDASGNSYKGEWLQIQKPSSVVVSSYSMLCQNAGGAVANAPGTWYIIGSRDGTNWFLIDQRTVTSSAWAINVYNSYQVQSSQAYSYFRVVFNTTSVGTLVALTEWTLNGTIEGPSVSADGRLGLGVSNPVQALEVAGSAVVAGTLSAGNPLMFRNRIINGDMRVAQRGTSFTGVTNSGGNGGTRNYSLDRFSLNTSGGETGGSLTYAQTTDVPQGQGFANALSVTVTAAFGNIGWYFPIFQAIEGININDLMWGTPYGQPITVSFWWKSSLTGNFCFTLKGGGYCYNASYTYSTAASWQYFTITVPPPPNGATFFPSADNLFVGFAAYWVNTTSGVWVAGNSWGVTGGVNFLVNNGAYIRLTGVQLEKGSVATPFEVRPYATELALCQRYMFQMIYQDTAPCYQRTSVLGLFTIRFPVTMRSAVNPTLSGTFNASIGATDTTISSISTPGGGYGASATGSQYMFPSTQTLGNAGHIWINSTTAYIRWDAEL